ncbi:hypothetical protein ACH5RR_007898 [Cinchona calisaya]|uniref:Uncharacterized protein n=1 Tax=Cinchona calisaya TaxID=153742 RepID=A0ABD3AA24_9GENT
MLQQFHLGFSYEDPNSPETSSDDQQPTVEANEVHLLQNDFQDILHMQVQGVVAKAAITDSSSTTDTSLPPLSAVEEYSGSYIQGYHSPSPKELRDLRSIAKKMDKKGRLDKLTNVCVTERKSFLKAHFQRLWNNDDEFQRLDWDVLEPKIVRWN